MDAGIENACQINPTQRSATTSIEESNYTTELNHHFDRISINEEAVDESFHQDVTEIFNLSGSSTVYSEARQSFALREQQRRKLSFGLGETEVACESTTNTQGHLRIPANTLNDVGRTNLSKTRRLICLFGLWQSKSEMRQNHESQTNSELHVHQPISRSPPSSSSSWVGRSDTSIRRASMIGGENSQADLTSQDINSHNHHYSHNSLETSINTNNLPRRICLLHPSPITTFSFSYQPLTPTTISLNNPNSDSNSCTSNDDVADHERKIWQTFVLPIVLGCVIFTTAIWTRQISHTMINETIAMVFVLGAIFVTTSGLIFWLAKDREKTEEVNLNESDQSYVAVISGGRPSTMSDNHEQFHYQNQSAQSSLLQNSAIASINLTGQNTSTDNETENAAKCNCLVYKEYQPPDYYSAMQSSLPVSFYSKFVGQQKGRDTPRLVELNTGENDLHSVDSSKDRRGTQSSLPTYDEILLTAELASSKEQTDRDDSRDFRTNVGSRGGDNCSEIDDALESNNSNHIVKRT